MSIDFESTPDTYGNDFASDGPTAPRSQAYLHPVAMLFNWLFKAVALAVYLPLSLIFGADVSFFFSSKRNRRFSSPLALARHPAGCPQSSLVCRVGETELGSLLRLAPRDFFPSLPRVLCQRFRIALSHAHLPGQRK